MLINWKWLKFSPKEQLKHLCQLPNDYRLYRNGTNPSVRCQHVIIIDLETSNLILHFADSANNHYELIPEILQFACTVHAYTEFVCMKEKGEPQESKVHNPHPIDTVNEWNVSTEKLTHILLNLIRKYPNSVFVAHNGIAFDFKIIIAFLINQNSVDALRVLQKLRFYDTLPMAREKFPYKKEGPYYSYKNTDLYKQLCQVDVSLLDSAHNALSDCLITSHWVWALRSYALFRTYSTCLELITSFSHSNAPPPKSRVWKIDFEKIKKRKKLRSKPIFFQFDTVFVSSNRLF